MRKIELLQVGQTTITEYFTPYAAGVFWRKMSLSLADRALSPIETILGGTWGDLPIEPVSITGASFEDIQLSQVNSIADIYLQDGSFYFDEANQNIYIAIFDYRNFIINDVVKLGQTIGFIDKAQLVDINGLTYPLDTMVGSVNYEARLNDISISNQINDQQNGLFVYSNLAASIKNGDGEYDDLGDSITGNKAVLLIANLSDSPEEEIETGFPFKIAADPSDFSVKRSGIVETVDHSDPDNPVIKAIDDRANWTQTIGTNFLTVAEFANLPDKYVNDRKAIAIGAVNGVKAVPLRDDATAASFDYFICDTSIGAIQSISQVYFKGQLGAGDVDRFLTITTEYTVNLSTGIITILNCVKGDVFIYGVFTTLSETVEIILFLLDEYDNLAFIDSNFNLEEMEEIRALDYQTHVYITGKGKKLSDVIQKLASDIQDDMFPQGNVLTMRQSNVIRISEEEIPNYQIVQNPPKWDNNRTDTIKTITVNYNPDYRTKFPDTYYDDSLEQEAIDENIKAEDKSFDVNLTNEADVIEIFDAYYERFIHVPRTVRFDRTIPFTAGLSDFISLPVIRTSLTNVEKVIFVNGIYKITDINEKDNSIECVFFKDDPDRGIIIEWNNNPSIIFEWSDIESIIILEANL